LLEENKKLSTFLLFNNKLLASRLSGNDKKEVRGKKENCILLFS